MARLPPNLFAMASVTDFPASRRLSRGIERASPGDSRLCKTETLDFPSGERRCSKSHVYSEHLFPCSFATRFRPTGLGRAARSLNLSVEEETPANGPLIQAVQGCFKQGAKREGEAAAVTQPSWTPHSQQGPAQAPGLLLPAPARSTPAAGSACHHPSRCSAAISPSRGLPRSFTSSIATDS